MSQKQCEIGLDSEWTPCRVQVYNWTKQRSVAMYGDYWSYGLSTSSCLVRCTF